MILKFDFHFFYFQVTDTNDNPPVFSEPAYSFDIPENAPRGYQVGLILASDPDLGANSMISYTVISDWANDVFSLNPQTGVFTLTARLDYEEVSTLFSKSNKSTTSILSSISLYNMLFLPIYLHVCNIKFILYLLKY